MVFTKMESYLGTHPGIIYSGSPVRPLVITVTGGKGGTGKTTVAANLAFAFTMLQQKVLILDGNLGLSDVNVVLGLCPTYTIKHLLRKQRRLSEILIKGPGGMLVLPASSGNLLEASPSERLLLMDELGRVTPGIDILLIDGPPGISGDVMFFNSLAEELLVVITPEFTSLCSAYNLIKILATTYGRKRIRILVNFVACGKEAKNAFKTITRMADAFLGSLSFDYLGFIPRDERFKEAAKNRRLVSEFYPRSPPNRKFREIAKYFLEIQKEPMRNNFVPEYSNHPANIQKEGELK